MILTEISSTLFKSTYINYIYVSKCYNFSIFHKVLLVSTDPAHSLSDAFRSQFSSEPTSPNSAALPNLDVMEVDPSATVQVN